jgi:cobalt-zinc-cadmium efflux system outer membrane protein
MRQLLPVRSDATDRIVRSALRWTVWIVLVCLVGCFFPVREKIDKSVCELSKQPFDLQHLQASDQAPIMPPADDAVAKTAYDPNDPESVDRFILGEQQQSAEKSGPKPGERFDPFKDLQQYQPRTLQVPPDLLPTGPPKPLVLGPLGSAQRRQQLQRLFPSLRPPGPDFDGVAGPFGHPLTLADLQRIALASSPLIKQAVARVENARGLAFQAGLPPNPLLGFEDDTFGTTGGAGYVGGFMEQLFVTGGKLRLRRAVATMDLRNAEVALRRAQMDLATQVRTNYFQLLVARENMRINRILVSFVDAVYEMQAREVRSKAELTIAAYEPMYLRALANIARTNLITARNSYLQYWKQLAAAMGLPGLPLTQIAGRADMPIPIFDFAQVWTHVGKNHTDVVTADNTWHQARLSLLLAQAQVVPDVDSRVLIQKDYTGSPNAIAPSFATSIPVPIWNRNQGGIAAAQSEVVRAAEEPLRVRNDLYSRLSEAFNRYQSSRQNLALYRDQILPDLVRVYDAIYRRYHALGGVQPPGVTPATPPSAPATTPVPPLPPAIQPPQPGINDVVVAQQFLTSSIATYITNLQGMWQAVVDVTDLIQTNDMFRMGQDALPTEALPPPPNLELLKPLLPTHPCSPLPDPHLRGGDGTWPEALPTRGNFPMPHASDEARKPQPLQPMLTAAATDQPTAPPTSPQPGQPAATPEIREIEPQKD